MATHHRMQAMYHLMFSMQYAGIIKNEEEFRIKVLPVFDMLCEGNILSSNKTIDRLTVEAREKLNKIRERNP